MKDGPKPLELAMAMMQQQPTNGETFQGNLLQVSSRLNV